MWSHTQKTDYEILARIELTLGQRRRRLASIDLALGQYIVFSEKLQRNIILIYHEFLRYLSVLAKCCYYFYYKSLKIDPTDQRVVIFDLLLDANIRY